ncbi:MAG: hypothetical protein LBR55_01800, partial [Bacteroidales bacterium]|nr:hypothetical protein [Bacteroidales bacterium]
MAGVEAQATARAGVYFDLGVARIFALRPDACVAQHDEKNFGQDVRKPRPREGEEEQHEAAGVRPPYGAHERIVGEEEVVVFKNHAEAAREEAAAAD